MFEKNLEIAYLLDFYGEVLSERKQTVLDAYYNQDLSLGEIAEQIGISRQGVRELIKKAEEELYFYEAKLGLAERFQNMEQSADRIRLLLADPHIPAQLRDELRTLVEAIR